MSGQKQPPPQADTLPRQIPPWSDTPRRPLQRTVRILLECILAYWDTGSGHVPEPEPEPFDIQDRPDTFQQDGLSVEKPTGWSVMGGGGVGGGGEGGYSQVNTFEQFWEEEEAGRVKGVGLPCTYHTWAPSCGQTDKQTRLKTLPSHSFVAGR